MITVFGEAGLWRGYLPNCLHGSSPPRPNIFPSPWPATSATNSSPIQYLGGGALCRWAHSRGTGKNGITRQTCLYVTELPTYHHLPIQTPPSLWGHDDRGRLCSYLFSHSVLFPCRWSWRADFPTTANGSPSHRPYTRNRQQLIQQITDDGSPSFPDDPVGSIPNPRNPHTWRESEALPYLSLTSTPQFSSCVTRRLARLPGRKSLAL